MDIVDLIILLFFLLPVLSRFLGGLRKRPATPADSGEERRESALSRALREIEEALQDAGGQKEPEMHQPPPATVRETRGSRLERSEGFHDTPDGDFEHVDYAEFRKLTPVEIDESLFGSFDTIDTIRTDADTGPPLGTRIRKQLRRRRSLREAFLVAEVLGPPHSLRQGRKLPGGRPHGSVVASPVEDAGD